MHYKEAYFEIKPLNNTQMKSIFIFNFNQNKNIQNLINLLILLKQKTIAVNIGVRTSFVYRATWSVMTSTIVVIIVMSLILPIVKVSFFPFEFVTSIFLIYEKIPKHINQEMNESID